MQLLDASNLASYLVQRGRLPSAQGVQVRELAGGVSNVVLYVAPGTEQGEPFVVKQARGQLRTPEPWFCTVERIWREVAFLEACQRLLQGTDFPLRLPRVLWTDRENYAFAMTAAEPGHRTWKQLLLEGQVDPQVAAGCGQVLGTLHRRSWHRPQEAPELDDRSLFDQLRVDPYYRFVAGRDEQARPHLEPLIRQSLQTRISLVHADFSPKNLLVYPGGLMMVDFETGHFGDPAFDLGFFHAHLVLKCFHARATGLPLPRYLELLDAFREQYAAALRSAVAPEDWVGLVDRFWQHLAGCLLARVAGKSQIDYLHSPAWRNRVRQAALALWHAPPPTWEELPAWVSRHLESRRK